jgi:hypothetical protein
MNKNDDRPILTSIFYVLGALALVGAFFCIFESVSLAIAVAIAGVIYFGMGQAVEYLARTARSTERLCTIMESSVVSRLKNIESLLSPTTQQAPKSKIPPPPAPRTTRPEAIYHFTTDGSKQGPFTVVDMQDFRSAGVVADDTPVFREGEAEWKTFGDFPDLKS